MKLNLRKYGKLLREGMMHTLRTYPVETALAVLCCAGCFVCYETESRWLVLRLPLLPLFFGLALTVNLLAGRSPWRKVYWVSWLPLLPLACWQGLEGWYESESFLLTVAVLLPLALLASRRAVRNDRFVFDAVVWLRSALLALLFANVALGLFCAILFSTTYIFGLQGAWVEHVAVYAVILAETLAVPLLFLMMADRWQGADCSGNRVVKVLLDYIVTPALLIYTAILYLYMLRIAITWSLPAGGIAYFVFCFTLLALAVKAAQHLLDKRLYTWFFDRFSLFALPTQVLFWAGVVRRTGEYGLTEPRVYLLVCGGLMSLCVLLFLSRRTGRYLYIVLAGLLCFAALAYVPALRPERIALRSQERRVVRIARSLGRLGADGRLLRTPVPEADTVLWEEYRRLYASLEYLQRDSAAYAAFGVEHDRFVEQLPPSMRGFVTSGIHGFSAFDEHTYTVVSLPSDASFELDGRYARYYTHLESWDAPGYAFEDDTLRLWLGAEHPMRTIAARELLHRQFEQSGFDPSDRSEPTREQKLRMLDYRDDGCRIIFDYLRLKHRDSVVLLDGVTVHAVLLR